MGGSSSGSVIALNIFSVLGHSLIRTGDTFGRQNYFVTDCFLW